MVRRSENYLLIGAYRAERSLRSEPRSETGDQIATRDEYFTLVVTRQNV